MTTGARDPEWITPAPLSSAIFEVKACGLRLRRTLVQLGRRPRRLRLAADVSDFVIAAGLSSTPLWSQTDPGERGLELGKMHNLRRAAMRLDGLAIPAGATFSFWRQLGKASRRRGFVVGRMLREGCLVPSVGGGLCQLSNSLYQAALEAGCMIVERHAHSRVVPGSHAEVGQDATIAWSYVDLRFAADRDLVLGVRLDHDMLEVSLRAKSGRPAVKASAAPAVGLHGIMARNCASCDEIDCFRHGEGAGAVLTRTGFVVDGAWPEFQGYVAQTRKSGDVIALPLDGGRWGRARYDWTTQGFAQVVEAPFEAARRAIAWRLTPPQGAARREAEMRASAAIAASLGARLGPEITDLTISQTLLPFLWRDGWLGGRPFRVLMTRLPAHVLQARLDVVFAAHPDRATLADFRAPAWLVRAEEEALAAAEALITPHAEIAALYPGRAHRLAWALPPASAPTPGSDLLAFPGPTVARKGAFEVREAARRLGLAVRPLGTELEGDGFWFPVKVAPAQGHWLDGVAVVVQPAIVEEAPRRLLYALAAGVPVIATKGCGLDPRPGLTLVSDGEPDELADAITTVLAQTTRNPATVESRL